MSPLGEYASSLVISVTLWREVAEVKSSEQLRMGREGKRMGAEQGDIIVLANSND